MIIRIDSSHPLPFPGRTVSAIRRMSRFVAFETLQTKWSAHLEIYILEACARSAFFLRRRIRVSPRVYRCYRERNNNKFFVLVNRNLYRNFSSCRKCLSTAIVIALADRKTVARSATLNYLLGHPHLKNL